MTMATTTDTLSQKAYCILYNPLSATGQGEMKAHALDGFLSDGHVEYRSLLDIPDKRVFLEELPDEITPVLTGGDGTISRFINDLDGQVPARDILYFPAGSGNDFLKDLGKSADTPPFLLNPYLTDLPRIHFAGQSRVFLNGVGYGIDGYVCAEGTRKRAKTGKPINYTAVAVKGLVYAYKRTTATVTVDGKTMSFRHVWMTPTMKGRFFGGGMMCAPAQDRMNPNRTVSLMVMRATSKIRTLLLFPSIFKGEHVRDEKIVSMFPGHMIHVKFDRPTALQIDGEVYEGIEEYTVKTDNDA